MTERGFSCIALDDPKCAHNVGGVMRAAQVFGAGLIVIGGSRSRMVGASTDTMKAWRHIPTIRSQDVLEAIPHDCIPVAVELIEGAIPLPSYQHPERAFYIFGGEDQTLGKRVLDRCRDVIVIPVPRCLNLAATVNVVLYDRLVKRGLALPKAKDLAA